jgi:hypothetical protein
LQYKKDDGRKELLASLGKTIENMIWPVVRGAE